MPTDSGPHAIDWPRVLDGHEAAIDQEIAEDDAACTRVACRLIHHAAAWLHLIGAPGSAEIQERFASQAADALHAAGKLTPDPHHGTLLHLSLRLREAIAASFGTLTSSEFEQVSVAADAVLSALQTRQETER